MKDPEIVTKRLILKMGQTGSIEEACKEGGISRATYYRWQRAFATKGEDGLKVAPPKPVNRFPAETEETVLKMTARHPKAGRKQLAKLLKEAGTAVSPSSVRNIWMRHGLDNRAKRIRLANKSSS